MSLQPSAATPLALRQVLHAFSQGLSGDARAHFETALVAALGMQDGIALSSLMRNTFAAVAAAKLRCRPNASIILPRYSCPSFIHGIQAAGMPHRYCDSDATHLAVRPTDLIQAADETVGAVLIPNLFGLSADMVAISELCRERGWLLLEGADYTLGGSFAGKSLGSLGDYAILNFQEGKALPVGGGMALSRFPGDFQSIQAGPAASSLLAIARATAYSVLIRPASYGLFSAALQRFGIAKKKFSMEDTIRETRSEYDYTVAASRLAERISDYQGALGSILLAELPAHVAKRNANAALLEQGLADIPGLELIARHPSQDRCHYVRYPVLVGHGRRDNLARHLIRHGFEASPMYVEHGMRVDATVHPGAARICEELLTLPCHPFMTQTDLRRLTDIARAFLNNSHHVS